MAVQDNPRHNLDPYLEWVAAEALPVAEDYGLDLFKVPTAPWPRFGISGAAVHLKGRGDFTNMFLYEIAPGLSTSPQQHLYEEVVYVLEGQGSTQLEFGDGRRHHFEWGPHSLFAIPLNAKHRHFNGSGIARALLVSTTNLPLVLNTFHNEKFVFGNDFNFPERVGKHEFLTGDGELALVRQGQNTWETNFVPDLGAIELQSYAARGADSMNIMFVLADGLMHAHLSEMYSGTYKKAHRHAPGFHVMCVFGEGYSLMWYEGEPDFIRIDWGHGTVLAPADKQFHQHFATSADPVRYLATAVGGLRYPFTTENRRNFFGLKAGEMQSVALSTKLGGDQIEYEDQDPRIHKTWLDAMKKSDVSPRMEKYIAT
jgi:quercetin dioxygenase-like cupin family protein